jgi:hypothetical protein
MEAKKSSVSSSFDIQSSTAPGSRCSHNVQYLVPTPLKISPYLSSLHVAAKTKVVEFSISVVLAKQQGKVVV